jgi:hypothetical protein
MSSSTTSPTMARDPPPPPPARANTPSAPISSPPEAHAAALYGVPPTHTHLRRGGPPLD